MAEHAAADGRRGGRLSGETDRTKGCKIHFPFHFLSNKGAEVGGGGVSLVLLLVSRGKGQRVIKFIFSLLILCFSKTDGGFSSGVGTSAHIAKRKPGQRQ